MILSQKGWEGSVAPRAPADTPVAGDGDQPPQCFVVAEEQSGTERLDPFGFVPICHPVFEGYDIVRGEVTLQIWGVRFGKD